MYAMAYALTCMHTHTNKLIRILWGCQDGSVGKNNSQVGLETLVQFSEGENSLHRVVPDFRIHPYTYITQIHTVINNFEIIF